MRLTKVAISKLKILLFGRAAILMVVKENEMNIYGQRRFESMMVLRYAHVYV